MERRQLFILTLIFFVIVNTRYYWEGMLGNWIIPVDLVLFFTFILLVVNGVFYQLFLSIKDKFYSKSRLLLIALMAIVLGLAVYRPDGLFNFESKDLLVASREGAANCTTTFTLKKNNNFTERSICFGIEQITGRYTIKNDTIYFSDVKFNRGKGYYKFAVIEKADYPNKKIIGDLVRLNDFNDTMPHTLWITKNEITK